MEEDIADELPRARVELDDEVTKVYQDVFNREYQRALLREAAAKAKQEAQRRAKLDAEKSMRAKEKKGSTFPRVLGTLSELGKGLNEYEFGGLKAFYPESKTKEGSSK